MKLIDTHCHLNLSQYNEDYQQVLEHCHEKEVGLVLVGCDYASSKKAIEIAEANEGKNVWVGVGQHPTDNPEDFDMDAFVTLASSSAKVVGIGETGLDYFHLDKNSDIELQKRRQKEMFLSHIEIAHQLNLPIIIHCRDAHDDVTSILEHRFTTPSAHGSHPQKEFGVMHCFTGNVLQARAYVDLGFLISFTGIITFANQYDEVVREIPLEKITIETDSPFLTPQPYRGKRNNPAYVEYVARRIAEIKGISFEEVAGQTLANAKRLFGIIP